MKSERRFWLAVAAVAAIGLGLRIAAAQGALWLDEAWSAVFARDSRTPLGVLLNINHDNNHHLNTLWLQLVGFGAPPVIQRGLSIVSGTAAVFVAAAIGRRQSAATGLAMALAFAVSPLLVTYGAEARGYAPMLLALLGVVLLLARWLDAPEGRVPAVPLILVTLLGMLAQLTMLFGLAACTGWVMLSLSRARPPREALRLGACALLPVLGTAAAVLALIVGVATLRDGGLAFGNRDPFGYGIALDGIGTMLLYALGGLGLLALLGVDALARGWRRPMDRTFTFALAAAATPLIPLLLRLPNSGMPRYHLVSGVGVLIFAGFVLGGAIDRGGRLRWIGAAGPAVVLLSALMLDATIVEDRRADPGRALDPVLAAGAGEIAVEQTRATAVIEAAAAARHVTLHVIDTPCPATRFLFVDRDGTRAFPDPATRCGARYRPVAEGHPRALSGTHWKLYERLPAGAH